MILRYEESPVSVYGFNYQLGGLRRDLTQLRSEKVLANTEETLSAMGYRYCLSIDENETLLSLASKAVAATLAQTAEPRALVFQHCNAESAVMPIEAGDTEWASRNQYFAAIVMQDLKLDHVPYFCSFASGCAGFLSLLVTAGGLLSSSDRRAIVCVMADTRPPIDPPGLPFDLLRERILGSDHSSAFLVGPEERGYQLLGLNYYSTTRKLVPLVEIVKRTVEMMQSLAAELGLDLHGADIAIHYPNIFPDIWKMVTRCLLLPRVEHIMDEMAERAHCGATDSVISLTKWHRGQSGRLHFVVNYGVGLHLGVCVLREHATI
jgi:3-oxoacyl-[acyl-carrier-protein] synthase III